MNKFSVLLIIIAFNSVANKSLNKKLTCDTTNLVRTIEGDIKIGFLINSCNNSTSKLYVNTLINAAITTTERLNALEYTKPFKLGISVYEVCDDMEYYKAIFGLFRENDEKALVGLITLKQVPTKIQGFCEVLDIPRKLTNKFWVPLIKASVRLLEALKWNENITVISPNQIVLQEFYKYTRRHWMCIRKAYIYDQILNFLDFEGPLVVFGNQEQITYIINNLLIGQEIEGEDLIFVPLDGSNINDLPEASYIIEAPVIEASTYNAIPHKFYSPIFFEIANPILSYVRNITRFVNSNCNNTLYKLNCILNKLPKQTDGRYGIFTPMEILQLLKMNSNDKFNYNVYRVENLTFAEMHSQELNKVFSYNMFNDELSTLDSNLDLNVTNSSEINHICSQSLQRCLMDCINFKSYVGTTGIRLPALSKNIRFRSEYWVFALISVSVLGFIVCVAILIFLLIRLCKKQMFEGNPVLTILLLLTVMSMYCSIIPYTLEGNKITRNSICIARSLSLTLTYASAFSLLLARTILLATISKEIGFMSHVSGPVQSFLGLFIFGVQCAWSLQVVNHCSDIFKGVTMLFLLSYNILLLLLLLCICPVIIKAQRNYKEGKYITISILLITICWTTWISAYALLEEHLKDLVLCLGLVFTASIYVGIIFIPRTYLMTIAVARDRLTSALPSLATAPSTMDIYRTNSQPVYDCINVTAINAAHNSTKNIPAPPPPQPDLYSCPTLPEDVDFEIQNCETPKCNDKITRF